MEIFDFTGTHWVTIFDGPATELLGEEADEVAKYQKHNYEKFEKAFKVPLFKTYVLRINSRKRGSGRTLDALTPRSTYLSETSSSAGHVVTPQQKETRDLLHEPVLAPRGNFRNSNAARDCVWTVTSAAPVSFENYISHLQSSIDAIECHSTI